MARHTIPITNGKGSIELVNGNYKATVVANGYDASTLNPQEISIVEGTNNYTFTVSGNGTLTLHVTDTGEKVSGIQVVGAKFIITDETGTTQGKEAITNQDGNALFENVPYYETDSPVIYYKQISSDGAHTFDDNVKSVIMNEQNITVEIENPTAPERNITLTDASYPSIVIKDAQITLENS